METKANFLLIGIVTVLGLLGLLGLLVWFAKVEIDRQYAEYAVLFESVSGLGMAADVRYNGLSVGSVVGLDLHATDPSKVRVQIEVEAGTPVKTDTTAQLSSQGVTGVAFVALTGGSLAAPLLRNATDPETVPLIPAERSAVQALTEDAPDLVTEAVAAIREVRSFLGQENRESVAGIIANLENASGQLEAALTDFSDISRTVSEGTAEIARFTGRLDEIGATVQTTLVKVNETLDVTKAAIAGIEPTLQSATGAFTTAEQTIADVDNFFQTRVPGIADELTATIRSIETATEELRIRMDGVLTRFGGSADAATQRFTELESTIETLDLTLAEARSSMAAVESASVNFQGLVDGEGKALVKDARATLASLQASIASANTMMQEDVPAILADIRKAVASATEVVETVSTEVGTFTERLNPLVDTGEATLEAATETMQNANRTLANLDQALRTTEGAMGAAERTFSGAEAVIASDLGPAISDARAAAEQFEATMATVAEDIPAITGDVRTVMARALDVIEQIDDAVSSSTPPIQSFARTGLPAFTNFAREAEQLVAQLEKLARSIERDPPRFFFGNNLPDFRR